jgi:eukaryotic-like serine/threonine-protein kinase
MSLIGTTLNNRFYILKSLGKGGFGHTYLAEDRGFQARHHCVVKHLDPAKENLPYLDKIKELFEREADTLAKLSLYSNNLIPKLIDRFAENSELYLVQEFINGAPLSAELLPGKKLTQIATIDVLTQILTPLEYCHKEELIHRDIKPDNIMRRSPTELVLIDFGIAKDMGAASITKHSYGGTPGYAPEEQQYGQPELASDVYAVGKIAIQALTGLSPTQLRRNRDTMAWEWRQHCNVTDGFAAVLDRMVELLAARRYQNASEALAALQTIPRGGNTLISSPTPPSVPQVTGGFLQGRGYANGSAQPPSSLVGGSQNPLISASLNQRVGQQQNPVVGQQQTPVVERSRNHSPQATRQKFTFQTAKLEKELFGIGSLKISRISGSAEYVTEDLGGVKLDMVYIPAGSCMMGSNEYNNEKPIHRVNVPAFYMGKYAITQQQYEAVMGKNPARFKGSNRPVESVNWDEGMEFCAKLSQRTGRKYGLPSESQWEYACRAGTTTPFCCGETISTDLANYNGNYTYKQGLKGKYREQTTPVGDFPPNAFGLYDMHGNVWEWCLDTGHENYNGAPTDGSAWIENENDNHLLRGGSWDLNPDFCRCSGRNGHARDVRYGLCGFRVVCPLSPGFP